MLCLVGLTGETYKHPDDKQLWGNEDEERSQIVRGGNNDQVELHHQSWLLNTQPHNWKQPAGVWGVNAELTHSKLVPDMKVPRATQRGKQQPTSPRPWLNVWHSSYHTFFISLFCRSIFTHGHNSLLSLQPAFSKKIPDFCLIR